MKHWYFLWKIKDLNRISTTEFHRSERDIAAAKEILPYWKDFNSLQVLCLFFTLCLEMVLIC